MLRLRVVFQIVRQIARPFGGVFIARVLAVLVVQLSRLEVSDHLFIHIFHAAGVDGSAMSSSAAMRVSWMCSLLLQALAGSEAMHITQRMTASGRRDED